jgi:hypothetical protein
MRVTTPEAVAAFTAAHPDLLPEPLREWVLPWRDDPAVLAAWGVIAAALAAQTLGGRGGHTFSRGGPPVAFMVRAIRHHAENGYHGQSETFRGVPPWIILSCRLRLAALSAHTESHGTDADRQVVRGWVEIADQWWREVGAAPLRVTRNLTPEGRPCRLHWAVKEPARPEWPDPTGVILAPLLRPWEAPVPSYGCQRTEAMALARARAMAKIARAWGEIPDTAEAEAEAVTRLTEIRSAAIKRYHAEVANTPDDLFGLPYNND